MMCNNQIKTLILLHIKKRVYYENTQSYFVCASRIVGGIRVCSKAGKPAGSETALPK